MSYTLTIGDYATERQPDGASRQFAIAAHHPGALPYGEPESHRNERQPSYQGWARFADFTGLKDLFYAPETGLLSQGPACRPLTPAHQQAIEAAYEAFRQRHPFAHPGMGEGLPEEDVQLARLTWLRYWVGWALANCAEPVFCNS